MLTVVDAVVVRCEHNTVMSCKYGDVYPVVYYQPEGDIVADVLTSGEAVIELIRNLINYGYRIEVAKGEFSDLNIEEQLIML